MQPTGLHEHLAHVSWDVGCFMAFWFLFNRDQVDELKQEIPLIEKSILIKKKLLTIFSCLIKIKNLLRLYFSFFTSKRSPQFFLKIKLPFFNQKHIIFSKFSLLC
jgi:hypothetical protein